jgi:hypothetical protein
MSRNVLYLSTYQTTLAYLQYLITYRHKSEGQRHFSSARYFDIKFYNNSALTNVHIFSWLIISGPLKFVPSPCYVTVEWD